MIKIGSNVKLTRPVRKDIERGHVEGSVHKVIGLELNRVYVKDNWWFTAEQVKEVWDVNPHIAEAIIEKTPEPLKLIKEHLPTMTITICINGNTEEISVKQAKHLKLQLEALV